MLAKLDEKGNLVVFEGIDTEWATEQGFTEMEVIKGFDGQWILEEQTKMPEYIKRQEQAKKEQLEMLSMSKRELVIALEDYNVTYKQIEELLENNDRARMEWRECERVYRNNEHLDLLCSVFGVTSKQLDEIFIGAQNEMQ